MWACLEVAAPLQHVNLISKTVSVSVVNRVDLIDLEELCPLAGATDSANRSDELQVGEERVDAEERAERQARRSLHPPHCGTDWQYLNRFGWSKRAWLVGRLTRSVGRNHSTYESSSRVKCHALKI